MKQYFVKLSGVILIAFIICIGKQPAPISSEDQNNLDNSNKVQSPIKKYEEKKITTTDTHLPLGITKEMPLNKVELHYGFYSSKTGAGRQEVSFFADGTVKLFFSRSYDDSNPKVLEVKCSSDQILRLFDFLEGMGFLGLPDEFSSNNPSYARRLLKFSMPGREKVVAVDEPGNYVIEQCIGAIKFCAGLCTPEAINQRFFPNL